MLIQSKRNKMLIQKQSLMMNLLLWIIRAITNLPARINKKWKYSTFQNFANLKQSTIAPSRQSHKACIRKPCGLSGGIEIYRAVSSSIEWGLDYIRETVTDPRVSWCVWEGKKRQLFLNSQLNGMFDFTPHHTSSKSQKLFPYRKAWGWNVTKPEEELLQVHMESNFCKVHEGIDYLKNWTG